jgi:hypothetical protein
MHFGGKEFEPTDGPIEILCKEIGFHTKLESVDMLVDLRVSSCRRDRQEPVAAFADGKDRIAERCYPLGIWPSC